MCDLALCSLLAAATSCSNCTLMLALDSNLPTVDADARVCIGFAATNIQCPSGQVITVTSALYA